MPEPLPRVRLLRGDEADPFDEHRRRLRRAVQCDAIVSDAIADAACAYAWLQFLRRQPDRETAVAWLRNVAINEAWRLSTQERRPLHLDEATAWQERCGEICDQGQDGRPPRPASRRRASAQAAPPPDARRRQPHPRRGHSRHRLCPHQRPQASRASLHRGAQQRPSRKLTGCAATAPAA